MRRLATALTIICASTGCTTSETSVCEEAAVLLSECTGEDVSLPAECTDEASASAQTVVDAGCSALAQGKADGWTQLCQPHLKKWFGFWPGVCRAEEVVCESSESDQDPTLCNGSENLCEKPYDEVTYGTSHNAFNVAKLEYFRPNQSFRMYVQLVDGMRALMIDTYADPDDPTLAVMCHDDCKNGKQTLEEGLQEIRDFLDCYPQEVVTILLQPQLGAEQHRAAFAATGLDQMAYVHAPGQAWPTLGQLIDEDKRVVVFAEPCQGDSCPVVDDAPDWYQPMWEHAFDNDFVARNKDDFSCDLARGNPNNALFGLNHFIAVELFGVGLGGDAWAAIGANKHDNIMAHVTECEGVYGRIPNFLSVDFYDSGATLEIVRELNQR